jgi:hypothetical protein
MCVSSAVLSERLKRKRTLCVNINAALSGTLATSRYLRACAFNIGNYTYMYMYCLLSSSPSLC